MSSHGSSTERTENTGASGQRVESTRREKNSQSELLADSSPVRLARGICRA